MMADALTEIISRPEEYANFIKKIRRIRKGAYAADGEGCGVLSGNADYIFKGLLKITALEYLVNKKGIEEYREIGKRGKKFDREIKELEKLCEKALTSYAVALVAMTNAGEGAWFKDAVMEGRFVLQKDMLEHHEEVAAFNLAKEAGLITEEKGFYRLK